MKRSTKEKMKAKRRRSLFIILLLLLCLYLGFTRLGGNSANADQGQDKSIVTNNVEQVPKKYINLKREGGLFELPVNGATGFAAIDMNLYEKPSTESTAKSELISGTAFKILKENGNWWFVESDKGLGWLENTYCMINLPDIIPSIIYDNTNSYSSILQASGTAIPSVTGMALYESLEYNNRINQEEYLVPALYSTAKKISKVQSLALDEQNTLIIYEAYRPYEVQRKIVESLDKLFESNQSIQDSMTNEKWSKGWFISQGISMHQRGAAIDVSLGKVDKTELITTGDYKFLDVTTYSPYTMPTTIHNLSIESITFEEPVSARSDIEWLSATPSSTMTQEALLLQKYCNKAGLTPLASEWWHFSDLQNNKLPAANRSVGQFIASNNMSVPPLVDPQN